MTVKHVQFFSFVQIWALNIWTTAEVIIISTCLLSLFPERNSSSLWFSSTQLISLNYDNPGFCLLVSLFYWHRFVSTSFTRLLKVSRFLEAQNWFSAGLLKHSKTKSCNPFDDCQAQVETPTSLQTSSHLAPPLLFPSIPPVKRGRSVFILRVWRR